MAQLAGGQKVVGVGRDDEHVSLHLAHVQVTLHTTPLLHPVLPLLDEAVSLALRLTRSSHTHLRSRLLDLIHVPVLALVCAKQRLAVVAALALLARAEAVAAGRVNRLSSLGIVVLRGLQNLLLRGNGDGDLDSEEGRRGTEDLSRLPIRLPFTSRLVLKISLSMSLRSLPSASR